MPIPRRGSRGRAQLQPLPAFVFAGAGLVLAVWLICVSTGQLAVSDRTQHAPVQTGQVMAVHQIRHTTRSSTYYTSQYVIALAGASPATGDSGVTTAHVRGHDDPSRLHQSARVVVDPKNPRWAEFPGHPFYTAGHVVVAYLVLLWPVTFVAIGVLALRRRRRSAPPPAWLVAQPGEGFAQR